MKLDSTNWSIWGGFLYFTSTIQDTISCTIDGVGFCTDRHIYLIDYGDRGTL